MLLVGVLPPPIPYVFMMLLLAFFSDWVLDPPNLVYGVRAF